MKRQRKQRGQNNPVSVLEEDWSCFEKKKERKKLQQLDKTNKKKNKGRNQQEKDKLNDK